MMNPIFCLDCICKDLISGKGTFTVMEDGVGKKRAVEKAVTHFCERFNLCNYVITLENRIQTLWEVDEL